MMLMVARSFWYCQSFLSASYAREYWRAQIYVRIAYRVYASAAVVVEVPVGGQGGKHTAKGLDIGVVRGLGGEIGGSNVGVIAESAVDAILDGINDGGSGADLADQRVGVLRLCGSGMLEEQQKERKSRCGCPYF
jgi:hypothetical protein